MTDRGLLDRYVREGSQAAFAELASRHMRMVYSTCRRDLADAQLAEDATQAVFILFAQKAKGLTRDVSLSGWLFTAARLVARNAARREATRKRHELEAIPNMEAVREPDAAWAGIEPWLNDALSSLQPSDREAVLMRYFDGLSVRDLAGALGISEDTAGKRVTRAVERMRRFLRGKDVTVTSVVLAMALAAHGTMNVPPRLAASIALAPTMPLPPIADIAHSLTPTGTKGVSAVQTFKLTAAVCGLALVATTAAVLVRHQIRAEAGGVTAGAPQGVLLRYKFQPGQIRTTRILQTQQGSATIGNTTVPLQEIVTLVLRRTIDSVAEDGTAKGTMQVTSMDVTMNGRHVDLPPAQAAGYLKPQAITITPTGDIKASAPPAANDPVASGIWSAMELSGCLPEQAVAPGARWESTEKVPGLGMNMTIPCVLTGLVTKQDHHIARISQTYATKVTPGLATTPMQGSMTGKGVLLFDRDLGEIVENDSTFRLDTIMNVAPPGTPAQSGHVVMDIDMQMKLDPAQSS